MNKHITRAAVCLMAVLAAAGCNNASKKAKEEAARAAAEQARLDSLKQAEMEKKQEEAKYKKINDINKRASVFEGLFKKDQNTTNEEQK